MASPDYGTSKAVLPDGLIGATAYVMAFLEVGIILDLLFSAKSSISAGPGDPMGLTFEERNWLDDHYEDEFMFLLLHGLDVYKPEHRQEGRAVLQALMLNDDDASAQTGDSQGRQDTKPLSDEQKLWLKQHAGRTRWQGHVADCYFSKRELEYVNRDWGSSSACLYHLDLNFYNHSDCQKGKTMVSAFLAQYDESEARVSRPLADRLFSKTQLYYVNRTFGSSTVWLDINELDDDLNRDENYRRVKRYSKLEPGDEDGGDGEDENESASAVVLGSLHVGKDEAGPRQLADHFFSQDEIDFVNKVYGDSLSFMIRFGLKFHRGRDCKKARPIAAFLLGKPDEPEEEEKKKEEEIMDDDGDDEWTDEEDDDDDDYDYGLDLDMLSSPANGFFFPKERKFMSGELGSVEAFMLSYGLKFYKSDDRKEARMIMAAFRA